MLFKDDFFLFSWNGIFRIIRFEIYREFIIGNWVVNKNKEVFFCVVGGDIVLEYFNWFMKVFGGFVGIILNESVRVKFFFIVLELVRLIVEVKVMVGFVSEGVYY